MFRINSYDAIKDAKGNTPSFTDTLFSFFHQPVTTTVALAAQTAEQTAQPFEYSGNEAIRLVKPESRSTDYGTFPLNRV